MKHEEVMLSRSCKAVQIPSGDQIILEEGTHVRITQSLGGSYTVVTQQGYMVRINDADADALGKKVLGSTFAEGVELTENEMEEALWAQLRTCYDPEIPVNIVELGLVYSCKLSERPDGGYRVDAKITLTAPGCGMGPVLANDARTKMATVPGVREVEVDVVFEPQWDKSMMSEAARLQLGM
jgi:probable FeS assembly SUF system protein SufT